MARDPSVQRWAEAFVRGELPLDDVYRELADRAAPIGDSLESDLWGLVFEVGDRDLSEQEARDWLREKYPVLSAAPSNVRIEHAALVASATLSKVLINPGRAWLARWDGSGASIAHVAVG